MIATRRENHKRGAGEGMRFPLKAHGPHLYFILLLHNSSFISYNRASAFLVPSRWEDLSIACCHR